jgi:hypothetical protein
MDYYAEYLKYKLKYTKLKKKLGGLFPYKMNLSFEFPETRYYEKLYIYNCSLLPGYNYPYVNIQEDISDETLTRIERRFENEYQKTGFIEISNLVDENNNLKVPNNTVFTYVIFPIGTNQRNFGLNHDVTIRFHRVESAFEIHTKHDYIIKRYAEANRLDPNNIDIYCGGEFKITKNADNQIFIVINRSSGTVSNCWEQGAPEVKLDELIKEKTSLNVQTIQNSMLDKTSNDYNQFFESYDYLREISNLGVKLNFFKSCPSQFDTTEPDIKYIDDIRKEETEARSSNSSPKRSTRAFRPPPMRKTKRSRFRRSDSDDFF